MAGAAAADLAAKLRRELQTAVVVHALAGVSPAKVAAPEARPASKVGRALLRCLEPAGVANVNLRRRLNSPRLAAWPCPPERSASPQRQRPTPWLAQARLPLLEYRPPAAT